MADDAEGGGDGAAERGKRDYTGVDGNGGPLITRATINEEGVVDVVRLGPGSVDVQPSVDDDGKRGGNPG